MVDISERRESFIKVTCSGCGHKWKYAGTSKVYAVCSRCRKNVKIQELKL